MRILYFTRDYTPHDFRFLNAIVANGHEVYYLRLENKVNSESRPLPAQVHIVEWKYGKGAFDPSTEDDVVNELKKVFRQIEPDVIHSGPLTDTSYLAAKADLHPHVAMSWGFDLLREIVTSDRLKKNAAFALANADWFLGDCYVELDTVAQMGMSRERATIFPWGIDPVKFSPGTSCLRDKLAEPDEFLILSLRTMEPNYSVETVVRGFLLAAKTEPAIRLALMSDGSQMQMLKDIASQSEEGARINWLGRQSNDLLVDYYRAADLYVSASIVDGSSVSLLEAMGCGVPVLMSDIPGNLEWVTDGQNGSIFKTKDERELAEKIVYASRHREEIRSMAAKARELICEKADWDKNKLKLTTAYQGAIDICKQ